MQDFQTIAHLIPSFDNYVDDPPATMAAQSVINSIFMSLLGQSSNYIQPVLFKSGQLIVYARASIWGQHIQHRHQRLMQQCKAAGLHVTKIKVKVMPDAVSSAANEIPRPSTYNANKASEHLDKLVEQIDKEELTESISRLAERIRENHRKNPKQK